MATRFHANYTSRFNSLHIAAGGLVAEPEQRGLTFRFKSRIYYDVRDVIII